MSEIVYFFKDRPFVDNDHVGKIGSPRVGARRCLLLCNMFIGDTVVSCSIQVFYCDNKSSNMAILLLFL